MMEKALSSAGRKIRKLFLPATAAVLGLYFVLRLINFGMILREFPLGRVDVADYMALLFFLAHYGYHAIVPQWYNGFVLFQTVQPGWYFSALPFYYLFKSIPLAAYLSAIAMFLASFMCIFKIGKHEGLSFTEGIVLFLLVFANPTAIGEFLRLGRMPELFGFTMLFAMILLMFSYKDKPLGRLFFFIFVPLSALNILAHFSETILAGFAVLSLMLMKSRKEQGQIILGGMAGMLLSSFWWIPFLNAAAGTSVTSYGAMERILNFDTWLFDSVLAFIIPLALWFSVVLYRGNFRYRHVKEFRRELLFYAPILLLSVLFFSRLIVFIPVLKHIFPDALELLFIFYTGLFLLKTERKNTRAGLFIGGMLLLAACASVALSASYTPWFAAGDGETELLAFIQSNVPAGSSLLILDGKDSTSHRSYDYLALYSTITTPAGDYEEIINAEYIGTLRAANRALKDDDCNALQENLERINATHILVEGYCSTMSLCAFDYIGIGGPHAENKEKELCLYARN